MPRSLVSIDDLSNAEIEAIFALADEFIDQLGEPGRPYRVRGRLHLADDIVFSTLFFEPSTRTRLSFESAIHRLGGHILTSADPHSSSAAKGETIADTVRVVETYAEAIIIRHPWEGAARVAARYSDVPVVNAGDGGHEHPTQTLCDLYTLRREKGSLKDLNVVICGDLKHGRTVHSLVFALARFGARIITYPAPGLGLPDHIGRRLREKYSGIHLGAGQIEHIPAADFPADGIYVIPEQPNLDPDLAVNVKALLARNPPDKKIDAFYLTRPQRERLEAGEAAENYPVFGRSQLKDRRFRESSVMHPLPRVSEMEYELDEDRRAVYFKQASYGVPVRMALLALLLGLRPGVDSAGAAAAEDAPIESSDGIGCANPRCVSSQESERRYLRPSFRPLRGDPVRLQCVYCDHEIAPLAVGRSDSHKYDSDLRRWASIPRQHLVFFRDESDARAAGYEAYRKRKLKAES